MSLTESSNFISCFIYFYVKCKFEYNMESIFMTSKDLKNGFQLAGTLNLRFLAYLSLQLVIEDMKVPERRHSKVQSVPETSK